MLQNVHRPVEMLVKKGKEEKIRGGLRGGDSFHLRYLICGGRNKQEYTLCGKYGKIFGLE